MLSRIIYLIILITNTGQILQCYCASSESIAYPLPPVDNDIATAVQNVENVLKNNALSNAESTIVSQGIPAIIMNDISMNTDNSTTVYLTNLNLIISPIQVTGIKPDLRIMNLNVNITQYSVEVIGNYIATFDSTNQVSPLPASKQGRFVLSLHDVDARGVTAMHLDEDRLTVHGADLTYEPKSVVFTVQYQTEDGFTEVNEDRSDHVEGQVTKRIFDDVAYHINNVVKEKLNGLLTDVSVFQLVNNQEVSETFASFASYQRFSLNQFVDQILNGSRDEIPVQMSLPNYEQMIGKKVGMVTLGVRFLAEDGWFQNVKTVERIGDITVNFVQGATEVTSALQLKTLVFGYNRYSVQLMVLGPRGRVNGKVDRNLINIRVAVKFTAGKCNATLTELKFRELKGINVKLTGLGPFNWILSAIATSIANSSTARIIELLEESLREEIQQILNNLDCGGFFMRI